MFDGPYMHFSMKKAPKSAAERMREYRARMDTEKTQERLEKCRNIMRKLRKKPKSKSEKSTEREATRKRVQEYRRRQKARVLSSCILKDGSSGSPPYKSANSFGKAIKRAQRNLPRSPRKQTAVVRKLAESFNLLVQPAKHSTSSTLSITADTMKMVKDFYECDDVSRQLPGKKDFIIIREDGKKEYMQKRLLVYHLREVYTLFQEQNPNVKIGLSKFCEMRPKHVRLVSDKDQIMCCCPYCENTQLMISAAPWKTSEKPKTIQELLKETVCQTENKNCMKRSCQECGDIESTLITKIDDDCDEVHTKQWEGGHLVQKDMSINEFFTYFKNQLTQLSNHIYNKRRQWKEQQNQKSSLQPGQLILLTDFAENYVAKFQNEVMAAHWTHTSAETSTTIYTAVCYFRKSSTDDVTTICLAVISDTQSHGTAEVAAFNEILLNYLSTLKQSPITSVYLWTDGAAQHFKNRKAISYLCTLSKILGCNVEWNYNESYHGKGPHDGVGATLKRSVWKRVLQGNATVQNAEQFYDITKSNIYNIHCFYVPAGKIDSIAAKYVEEWKSALPVVGIQQARCVKIAAPNTVGLFSNTGDVEPFKKHKIKETQEETSSPTKSTHSIDHAMNSKFSELSVGDYVLVHYPQTGQYYVGHIILLNYVSNMCSVQFMRRREGKNTYFVYPTNDDIDEISPDLVLSTLPKPKEVRGKFIFNTNFTVLVE